MITAEGFRVEHPEVPGTHHRAALIAQCSIAAEQTIDPHCARPGAALFVLHHMVSSFRSTPQIELLVPFFELHLHMTAIHSHGWRFPLVRPDKLLNPTRFSLKTFSSPVGGRNTLARCCLACSGIAGIQAALINARKNPLVENWA